MWIRWALISQVAADISLGQRVFCIFLRMFLSFSVHVCVYMYACNISFSLAECWLSRKTGSQMFNKPRGGHRRAARYNRRDSYVHSKLSKMTKFVVHTLEREHLRI